MFIGIDPGLRGAIVLMDNDDVVAVYDMPTRPKITKGKSEVCPASLNEILEEIKHISPVHLFAIVELVNGFGQGAASAFNFGEGFGILKACLECNHIAYTTVTPGKWQKKAGLIGKDKDYNRTLCKQLYPDLDLGAKVAGRADAALIARFGQQV